MGNFLKNTMQNPRIIAISYFILLLMYIFFVPYSKDPYTFLYILLQYSLGGLTLQLINTKYKEIEEISSSENKKITYIGSILAMLHIFYCFTYNVLLITIPSLNSLEFYKTLLNFIFPLFLLIIYFFAYIYKLHKEKSILYKNYNKLSFLFVFFYALNSLVYFGIFVSSSNGEIGLILLISSMFPMAFMMNESTPDFKDKYLTLKYKNTLALCFKIQFITLLLIFSSEILKHYYPIKALLDSIIFPIVILYSLFQISITIYLYFLEKFIICE